MKKLSFLFAIISTILLTSCSAIYVSPVVSTYDISYKVHYQDTTTTHSVHIPYAADLIASAANGVNCIYTIQPESKTSMVSYYASTAPFEVTSLTSTEFPRIKYEVNGVECFASAFQINYSTAW